VLGYSNKKNETRFIPLSIDAHLHASFHASSRDGI